MLKIFWARHTLAHDYYFAHAFHLQHRERFKMAASQSATSSPDRRAHGQTPSVADFLCPVCLQLLIEPVVMPCNHELCRDCFRQNVEEANLVCPLCRKRISSWARKSARDGTLVDQKRWQLIQKLFPERCKKRLQGEDDDDTDCKLNKYQISTKIFIMVGPFTKI